MPNRPFTRCVTVFAVAALIAGALLPRAVIATPSRLQQEPEWLVMLYQNADDEILEGDIYTDLNEAEIVGSTDDVVIVSQFDRFDGAFDGDGDWTTTKRYLVTQDDDLATVNSEELEDLGEIDSGSPEALADFLVWAITSFPAKKYALILSDHGAGWMGGWNDNDPVEGETTLHQRDRPGAGLRHCRDRHRAVRVHRLRRLPHEPGRGVERRCALRPLFRGVGRDGTGHRLGLFPLP